MYKVILVDDEYMILAGLQKIIDWHSLNIEVVGAFKSGQEALDYLAGHPVDIVITDITMPNMTGLEFIKTAKMRGHHFRFVILSGYQEFEYAQQGMALGATNYLLKPINKVELANNMSKIVAQLETEALQDDSKQFLFENMVEDWVTDDIETCALIRWMSGFGYDLTDAEYTVMICNGITDQKAFKQFLAEENQPFYFTRETSIILVLRGNERIRSTFLKRFEAEFLPIFYQLTMGEPVKEVGEVATSYQQAKSMYHLEEFYKVQSNQRVVQEVQAEVNQLTDAGKVSFTKFHERLSAGQVGEVETEIEQIFQQIQTLELSPDSVNYLATFILADIYRRFNQLGQKDYQRILMEIMQANDFQEMKQIVISSLETIQQKLNVKSYTPNVQNVLALIDENYKQDLTLKEVAEQFHLNVMYLGQLFKKETGQSFSKYLNHYRITKAKDLLIHSTNNVNEISEMIGYTSPGYFYKNFKKISGISPSDFRQKFGVKSN